MILAKILKFAIFSVSECIGKWIFPYTNYGKMINALKSNLAINIPYCWTCSPPFYLTFQLLRIFPKHLHNCSNCSDTCTILIVILDNSNKEKITHVAHVAYVVIKGNIYVANKRLEIELYLLLWSNTQRIAVLTNKANCRKNIYSVTSSVYI